MEGKKSFILYCDLMEIVHDLTDEEAGKLIKLIIDYVNDKDPKCEERIISLAFKQIKNSLKSDLKKWDLIKQKRSEAGKQGGRPKNEKQIEAKKANAFFEKQSEAKKAVSVNVNDNVSVNEITINNIEILEEGRLGGKPFKDVLIDIYSLTEIQFQKALTDWKVSNFETLFNSDKHFRDSLNLYIKKNIDEIKKEPNGLKYPKSTIEDNNW